MVRIRNTILIRYPCFEHLIDITLELEYFTADKKIILETSKQGLVRKSIKTLQITDIIRWGEVFERAGKQGYIE